MHSISRTVRRNFDLNLSKYVATLDCIVKTFYLYLNLNWYLAFIFELSGEFNQSEFRDKLFESGKSFMNFVIISQLVPSIPSHQSGPSVHLCIYVDLLLLVKPDKLCQYWLIDEIFIFNFLFMPWSNTKCHPSLFTFCTFVSGAS